MLGISIAQRWGRRGVASIVLLSALLTGNVIAEDARLDNRDGAGADPRWEKLYEEDGVVVSTHAEPGQSLPRMRGQTALRAPVLQLLALLLDDEHSIEWARGADETEVLRNVDTRTQIIYARSRQPWPVKDRDLVMKRTVEVLEPGKVYRVHLVCLPGEKPLKRNVVRVQTCETTFVLRALNHGRTAIDYRVHADPGGHTPDWLVRIASKSIPLDTLNALAKQIERTRGRYTAAAEHWASAR
jgi:hypothetical protein